VDEHGGRRGAVVVVVCERVAVDIVRGRTVGISTYRLTRDEIKTTWRKEKKTSKISTR
jgi:hypothetical protein